MKATQMKSMITKVMTAGLVAGAFLFAGPKKAEAAQVNIGVQIGRPVVYPDYYAQRRAYYDRLRWEEARRAEIARREAWRHEQWVRAHRYAPRPYGYYGR
jgi:hypothetical protein